MTKKKNKKIEPAIAAKYSDSLINSIYNCKDCYLTDRNALSILTFNTIKTVLADRLQNNITGRIKDLETLELIDLMQCLKN